MAESNIELTERGYRAWNEDDLEGLVAICHPEVEYYTSGVFPGLQTVYEGREGIRRWWADFHEPWQEIKVIPERIVNRPDGISHPDPLRREGPAGDRDDHAIHQHDQGPGRPRPPVRLAAPDRGGAAGARPRLIESHPERGPIPFANLVVSVSMRRGLLAGIACSCGALALIAATPAAASTTIGRLAPAPQVGCVGSTTDWLEPTVTTGTGYVVTPLPNAFALEISSWSHNAAPSPAVGALTFKVFRKVGEPETYKVVSHDGPRDLTAGTLNTFPTHIPVEPGDVIGINSAQPAATACNFFDATEGTH